MSWNTKGYWKKDDYNIERHPFETFVPNNTKVLIVGTFPTYKDNYTNNYAWYYGNGDNNFWKILNKIFLPDFKYDKGEEAIEERKDFFREHNLGITDMMTMCYRKGKSSNDGDLFPIILTDIIRILKNNNSIEKILLTSRSGFVSALELLKIHLIQNQINFIDSNSKMSKVVEGFFDYESRAINVVVPYSTSPKLINEGRTTFNELVDMYKYCFK